MKHASYDARQLWFTHELTANWSQTKLLNIGHQEGHLEGASPFRLLEGGSKVVADMLHREVQLIALPNSVGLVEILTSKQDTVVFSETLVHSNGPLLTQQKTYVLQQYSDIEGSQ